MSIVVKELLSSREFGTSGGFQGTRRFLVYDDEGGIVSPEDAIDAPGIPQNGATHPDWPTLLADTYTATPSDEAAGVWSIEWSYTLPISEGGDPGDTTEETLPLSVSVGVTAVDVWKSGPTIPATPALKADPGDIDIGGTLVASGRNPVSFWLPNAQISITETITASSFNAAAALSHVGKRNSQAFMGLEAGSVVFKGTNVSRQTAYEYTVVYEFGWDAWFHLRQFPEKDASGKTVANLDATEMQVYWRQPFADTVDFGFISSL